jgi:hypothetical protein
MTKDFVPHMAFISIKIEVRELLKTGEASSRMMSRDELKEHGINSSSLLMTKGKDKANCITNLKKKLEGTSDEQASRN